MTVTGDHLGEAVVVLRLRIRCVLGVWSGVGSYGPWRSAIVAIVALSYVLNERNICQHRTN